MNARSAIIVCDLVCPLFLRDTPFPYVIAVFSEKQKRRKEARKIPSLPKNGLYYSIVSPALAKPEINVAISIPAVTSAEKTSMRRVPAVTGMAIPVVRPLLKVPTATNPVSGGANVTSAPATGVNTLLVAAAENNCAVIVTVVPTKAAAAVRLKSAAMAVTVPSRGTEKAMLVKPVVSIVPPSTERPVTELPNPTAVVVPINPPATVVNAAAMPDAKGIIAPLPAAPVGPVGPVGPVEPVILGKRTAFFERFVKLLQTGRRFLCVPIPRAVHRQTEILH